MEHKIRDYFTSRMFRRQFAPALISALGLAVGDMADAIVVGRRMGVTGLAAISLALPVFMVINVLMHGLGLGGSIRFSTEQSQGKREQATSGFQGLLTAAAGIGVFIALLGNLLLPQLLAILGAPTAEAALYAASRDYVRIIIFGTPLFFISYISNYYLRNDDRQRLASFGFTVGNLSDIVLNVVFVLVMDMGAAGAAWATLAGQAISICLYLPGFSNHLRLRPFKPHWRGTLGCFRVGFASSVQYLFSMLFILIANNVLLRLSGSVGVAVFDMVQNASFLILYLYDGTAKAAQPLVSTYSGEHNEAGRRRALRLELLWGTAAGAAAIALVAVFPRAICGLFGLTDPGAVVLGVYALRVFCIGAAFAGVSILLESYHQACGAERKAFALTTLRGAAVLIPVTLLFAVFGPTAFWWLFPATEIVSLLLFMLWNALVKKKQAVFSIERIYSKTIRSQSEELGPLMAGIEVFCERWEASAKQSYFVTMTAEELCTAIMQNGFCGANGYLQVTLIAEEGGDFSLHIRDNAISFDPFSLRTGKADEDGNYDMDAMGVLVIREKAKDFFYRRYQGFNTLVVKI